MSTTLLSYPLTTRRHDRILQHKLIVVETKDVAETSMALDAFKKACNCGRGAVFLSVFILLLPTKQHWSNLSYRYN
jgi:hypothetical protein